MSVVIPLSEIMPSADNGARKDKGDISGLAKSMEKLGLIHPIVVTPVHTADHSTRYEIVAGERRFLAAAELGWGEIEATVIESGSWTLDGIRIAENVYRKNLSPIEYASAIHHMLEKTKNLEAVASLLNISVAHAARLNKLNNLCYEWVTLIEAQEDPTVLGLWPLANLELVAALEQDGQRELLAAYDNGKLGPNNQVISAKALKKFIEQELLCKLRHAVWDLDERMDLNPSHPLPSCNECTYRSHAQPELFGDFKMSQADRCLNIRCYLDKKLLWWEKQIKQAVDQLGDRLTTLAYDSDEMLELLRELSERRYLPKRFFCDKYHYVADNWARISQRLLIEDGNFGTEAVFFLDKTGYKILYRPVADVDTDLPVAEGGEDDTDAPVATEPTIQTPVQRLLGRRLRYVSNQLLGLADTLQEQVRIKEGVVTLEWSDLTPSLGNPETWMFKYAMPIIACAGLGPGYNHGTYDNVRWYDDASRLDDSQMARALLGRVCRQIQRGLRQNQNAEMLIRSWRSLKFICEVLGGDWEAMIADAETSILDRRGVLGGSTIATLEAMNISQEAA